MNFSISEPLRNKVVVVAIGEEKNHDALALLSFVCYSDNETKERHMGLGWNVSFRF